MMADTKQVTVAVATNADDVEIKCCVNLGSGVSKDIRARWPLYFDDWRQGLSVGRHIFAPATYIFFASVLPALAFGEQFRDETAGLFSIPHILCATAIAGVLQSVCGGQPLLIVGVAEPIVLVYYYIFKYCEDTDEIGLALFRPFCAWVLILTALMHFVLAAVNASEYIHAFTRLSGETFGTLIALLFAQAAVKGLKHEVRGFPIYHIPQTVRPDETDTFGVHRASSNHQARRPRGTKSSTGSGAFSWRCFWCYSPCGS